MITLVATLLLLGPPAQAQEEGQKRMSQAPQGLAMEDLALSSFSPKHADPADLFDAAAQFHKRSVLVQSGPDRSVRAVSNMTLFGRTILVLDQPGEVPRILETLQQLDGIEEARFREARDAGEAAPEPARRFETIQYSPRFVSVTTAALALEPFRRDLLLLGEQGEQYQRANLTVLREAGMLVVRDTAENLGRMREVLASVDRPAPQVLVEVQLLEETEGAGQGLPGELRTGLEELLGTASFQEVAASSLRVSVQPEQEVELLLQGQVAWRLQFECSVFDAETGTLALSDCALREEGARSPLFVTSCSVRAGEYTLLGAAGGKRLLTVLRMRPM